MSATTRHLLAAERALERVRRSMALAEHRSGELDLSAAWDAMGTLSLVIQAERFEAEDSDEEREL